MRKKFSFFLALILALGFMLPVNASSQPTPDWEEAMEAALDWIKTTSPSGPRVGAAVGEWAVLAMARTGRVTVDDPWVQSWFADIGRTLTEIDEIVAATSADISNPPSAGTFPTDLRRWTDFQRLTLALGAFGLDASDFMGWDITSPFSTFVPTTQRHSLNRTILADIFGLIALNSQGGSEELFLANIMDLQRADGSWSLDASRPTSPIDLDITAMALQALAPFYRAGAGDITDAVHKALDWLSDQDFSDSEGVSQMIVALTALGPAYASEAEYYVEMLLAWFDPATGGFRRPTPADPVNYLATIQGAYALVAYWRFVNDMSSLFEMHGDFAELIVMPAPEPPAENMGLPGLHRDVSVPDIIHPGRTFADVQGHENQLAIEALATRGIINGRGDNRFEPNATMTRAEFAAIIVNGLGLPARPLAQFEDVLATAWFAEAVGTAFYYEIIGGVSATRFNPRGTLTRQEAAVMIARAARLCGVDTVLTDIETLNILAMFGDYRSAASWAWDALAFCYREGILDEYEFYIRPRDAVTRGEVAEMLYRLLGRAMLI